MYSPQVVAELEVFLFYVFVNNCLTCAPYNVCYSTFKLMVWLQHQLFHRGFFPFEFLCSPIHQTAHNFI